jgi:hypothetical protein
MKIVKWLLVFVVVIQLVPFGHSHTNPPAKKEPVWDSPQTKDLIQRACYDCHSNETTWPWYSNVAPMSWLVQQDVNDGRGHLNFSEWNGPAGAGSKHVKDVAEQVKEGEMPPWFYRPMHPLSRLNDTEKLALIAGAEKTLGPQDGPEHSH